MMAKSYQKTGSGYISRKTGSGYISRPDTFQLPGSQRKM
jgi:hypothetical protein